MWSTPCTPNVEGAGKCRVWPFPKRAKLSNEHASLLQRIVSGMDTVGSPLLVLCLVCGMASYVLRSRSRRLADILTLSRQGHLLSLYHPSTASPSPRFVPSCPLQLESIASEIAEIGPATVALPRRAGPARCSVSHLGSGRRC